MNPCESVALICNEGDLNRFKNRFYSQDFKQDEYHYEIFEKDQVQEAVEFIQNWTEISNLNVIIRLKLSLIKIS